MHVDPVHGTGCLVQEGCRVDERSQYANHHRGNPGHGSLGSSLLLGNDQDQEISIV
jgi:hypothetical protein